jgi:hypothetical protein
MNVDICQFTSTGQHACMNVQLWHSRSDFKLTVRRIILFEHIESGPQSWRCDQAVG